MEGPQRCLQAFDHPARSLDGWWLLLPKTALGDFLNQRMQRLDVVELLQRLPVRVKNRITIFSVDQCRQ